MKKITVNTKLKQGDRIFPAIEVDGVIYWEKSHVKKGNFVYNHKTKALEQTNQDTYIWFNNFIVAQSQPKLEGVPVVNQEELEKIFITSFYTQKDIEKAIQLTAKLNGDINKGRIESIIDQINSISVIEVDEIFCIKDYF